MKALLISTLESLGYPAYLQNSMDDEAAYPDSFFTFMVIECPDNSHYDNGATSWAWRYQIAFYSSNPLLVGSVPDTARSALKEAGFIPIGKGRDLPSDVETHTGWTQDYYYIEQIKEE